MKHEEDALQRACVRWLRLAHPRVFAFHCPNGGKRNLAEAARFKAMGVIPGIPDLLILEGRGLAVELKSKKGVLTDNQKTVHELLRSRGWAVAVARDLDAFVSIVNSHMNSRAVREASEIGK